MSGTGPELDLGQPPRPNRRFLVGAHNGWHAVDQDATPLWCELHDRAICGAVVRRAKDDYQPYNPGAYPAKWDPCPQCRWTVAAATGTFDAALASLKDPRARAVALAILAKLGEDDPEDPAVIQLLAAVSRHAPVSLVAEHCAEGDCEHVTAGGEPGQCPERLACQACSLQAGDWAGEWQGQYREECTIEAPCAVLLALAKYAGVTP